MHPPFVLRTQPTVSSRPLQTSRLIQIRQRTGFELDFPNFFMRFQFMKNNLQWFQSPRPNSFNFTQTHQHHQPFPDLNHIHPNNLTPTPMPYHPLSPFRPPHPNEKQDTSIHFDNQGDLGKSRVINDLVVFSEEDDEVQTPRHQQSNKKNQELLTTGKKSQAGKNLIPKKSRPKDKGLRGLSLKSLNTVLQMKQGTYKQVANKLLESFEEEEPIRPANQETNIKRRVYDALNVLISLGLLKKQGRIIVGEKSPQDKNKEKTIEIQMLRKKLALKQYILQEKNKKLEEAIQKYGSIQNIFENNKRNFVSVQASQTFIPFPFIGMLTNTSEWEIVSLSPEELIMGFKQKVHPFGDIDVLNKIQRHFR